MLEATIRRWLIVANVPRICHTMTPPPPAGTVETRQVGSIDLCSWCQILTAASASFSDRSETWCGLLLFCLPSTLWFDVLCFLPWDGYKECLFELLYTSCKLRPVWSFSFNLSLINKVFQPADPPFTGCFLLLCLSLFKIYILL